MNLKKTSKGNYHTFHKGYSVFIETHPISGFLCVIKRGGEVIHINGILRHKLDAKRWVKEMLG